MTTRTAFLHAALAASASLAAAIAGFAIALMPGDDAGPDIPALGMSLEAALGTLGPTAFFGATCDRETEVYGNVAYADVEAGGRPLHVMAFVGQGDDRVFAVEIGTNPLRVASREHCAGLELPAMEELLSAVTRFRRAGETVRTLWKDFEGAGEYTTCRMNWRVSVAPSPFSSPEHIGADGISAPLPLVLVGRTGN